MKLQKLCLFLSSIIFLSSCSQNQSSDGVTRVVLNDLSKNQVSDGVTRVALDIPILSDKTEKQRTNIPVQSVVLPASILTPSTEQLSVQSSLYGSPADLFSKNLYAIVESALAYNTKNSSLPLTLAQREAEAEAIRKSHWPVIQPTARWNSSSHPYMGLDASYTLIDFGRSVAQEKQGDITAESAKIDFYVEQREVAADVISEVASITALIEKVNLITDSLIALDELSRYADIRVQAGFINESEPLLLNLRIAELRSEIAAMKVEITLKIKLLSAKLLNDITEQNIPSFKVINEELRTNLARSSLQLERAKLAVNLAEAKLEQAKKEVYPQINLEGSVGVSTSSSVKNHSVGLSLKSGTSLFTYGPSVRAAEAALGAARQEQNQTQIKLDTEWERIGLERERLITNRKTLKQLELDSASSLALFKSQFEVATATVSDGLAAHRTLLQTRQQLVDLEAQLVNLKASEVRISNGLFFTR